MYRQKPTWAHESLSSWDREKLNLNRVVAIKVLPPHIADNAEMRQLSEREAQTIAKLNHPHICVLNDVGTHDGSHFLVMEYLEGETLAQRLAHGPLPVEEAFTVHLKVGGRAYGASIHTGFHPLPTYRSECP